MKITESRGPQGSDSGEKVEGGKRQAMVDTEGRRLVPEPRPADLQAPDGVLMGLRLPRCALPFIIPAFADSGYPGETPAKAPPICIEIVREPPDQVGFAVHPRRWVVAGYCAG